MEAAGIMKDLQIIWPKLQEAGVLWVAGALAVRPSGGPSYASGRVLYVLKGGTACTGAGELWSGCIPDLNDLPTVYALLGELRRVTGDPGACVHPEPYIADAPTEWCAVYETLRDDDDGMQNAGPFEVLAAAEGDAVIMALCSVLGVEA